jgi:drug/metabolite transporter (DMT)-like permease
LAVEETRIDSEGIQTTPLTSSLAIPERITLLAFAVMVLFAGGAAVAVRITFAELPPFWSGGARFGAAALIFWILMIIRRVPVPRGRAIAGAALFGFLGVGASFLFLMWGLVETPAGLFQVIGALVPLLTIIFAFLHKLEKMHWQAVTGALLAVAGIAFAVNGYRGAAISAPHIIAILIGTACIAESAVVAKLIPRSHPIATNAVGMTVGAVMLLGASLIAGESWIIPGKPATWGAFIYLVVCVSVIVFMLYLWVLERWTASGTSFAFVLMPLVTISLASTIANEPVTSSLLVGAALVIAGVIFGAIVKPKKKKPRQTFECKPC